MTYAGADRENSRAYTQVFRSGMVEVVSAHTVGMNEAQRIVRVNTLAGDFLKQVGTTTAVLRRSEVAPIIQSISQ
jgi:hypothetical protein